MMAARGTFLAKCSLPSFTFLLENFPRPALLPICSQPGSAVSAVLVCLHVTLGGVLFPGVPLGVGEELPTFCIFRSGLEEMTTDGASFTLSSIITQNIFCSLVSFLLLISHMFLLGLVLFSPQAVSPTPSKRLKNFPVTVLLSYFISQYDLPCSIFLFFTPAHRSTERKWTLESDLLGF